MDVGCIVPKETDFCFAKCASSLYLDLLLEATVKLCLYKKGFCKCQIRSYGGYVGALGACNLDTRSVNTNYEMNALICYQEKCEQLKSIF
jgi:cardiolipin synthase